MINVQPAAGVDLEHSHHGAHVPRVVSGVYVRMPPAMRGRSVAPRVSLILVIIMNNAPTRPGRLQWHPSEPEFMPRPGPSAARACRDSDLPVDHVQVHAGGGRGFSAPLAPRWGHQPQLATTSLGARFQRDRARREPLHLRVGEDLGTLPSRRIGVRVVVLNRHPR